MNPPKRSIRTFAAVMVGIVAFNLVILGLHGWRGPDPWWQAPLTVILTTVLLTWAFRGSPREFRSVVMALPWALIAMSVILLVIVLFAVTDDHRTRTVLLVADAITFLLAFGALFILRRQSRKLGLSAGGI